MSREELVGKLAEDIGGTFYVFPADTDEQTIAGELCSLEGSEYMEGELTEQPSEFFLMFRRQSDVGADGDQPEYANYTVVTTHKHTSGAIAMQGTLTKAVGKGDWSVRELPAQGF